MDIPHYHQRSLLLPRYRYDVNTNTAPTYGSQADQRHRPERFHNGHTYSVNRSFYQEHRANSREPKVKQPGHNQTEQARRCRESEMFTSFNHCFEHPLLARVRNLYREYNPRCSSGQLRLTKKVNLCGVHAVLCVQSEHFLRGIKARYDFLLERAKMASVENKDEGLQRLVREYGDPNKWRCSPNCADCQRLFPLEKSTPSTSIHTPYDGFAAPGPVRSHPAISRYSQMAIVPRIQHERNFNGSIQNYVQIRSRSSPYSRSPRASQFQYYPFETNQEQQEDELWVEEDGEYH